MGVQGRGLSFLNTERYTFTQSHKLGIYLPPYHTNNSLTSTGEENKPVTNLKKYLPLRKRLMD